MLPIVLRSFAGRVGPFIGRAVKANPTFLSTLVAKLRASGAKVGDTVADIVRWVSNNKLNTILLASTLASFGLSVRDLFGTSPDPETVDLVTSLESIAQKANAQAEATATRSIMDVVNASTMLPIDMSEQRRAADKLLQEVLSWAKYHYGSIAEAKRGHSMSQAFVELSPEAVEHGFATLKI